MRVNMMFYKSPFFQLIPLALKTNSVNWFKNESFERNQMGLWEGGGWNKTKKRVDPLKYYVV